MRKVLLIILGIALTYGVNAQLRYGVKVGGTLSNLTSKVDRKTKNSDPKIGFKIGGILEYTLSSSIALQPELLYINNGGKFESDVFGEEDASFNLHQVQLPINVKYKMGTDDLKFYVTAGPYFGYIFSAKMKTGPLSIDVFDKKVNEFMQLKHFDFGIGVGFGTEFSNKYIVGVGYKYGIANLTKEKDATFKAGTFNLSVGYLF